VLLKVTSLILFGAGIFNSCQFHAHEPVSTCFSSPMSTDIHQTVPPSVCILTLCTVGSPTTISQFCRSLPQVTLQQSTDVCCNSLELTPSLTLRIPYMFCGHTYKDLLIPTTLYDTCVAMWHISLHSTHSLFCPRSQQDQSAVRLNWAQYRLLISQGFPKML